MSKSNSASAVVQQVFRATKPSRAARIFRELYAAVFDEPDTENSLRAKLILPIQRVVAYQNLLESMIKYTLPTHPDSHALRNALDAVKKIINHIDQGCPELEPPPAEPELETKRSNGGEIFDFAFEEQTMLRRKSAPRIARGTGSSTNLLQPSSSENSFYDGISPSENS